jgi:alkylhydroperoxidase family enzyme
LRRSGGSAPASERSLLARMDLANRPYLPDYAAACAAMAPVYQRATGRPLGDELEPLRDRPAMIEVLRHSLEERDERSLLARADVARVHALVEQALPASIDEARGFHARPADPVDAFIFVGTRYAARTTQAMVEALRRAGFDDLRILDLAHAVAEANQWARMHRLLGLDPAILTPATIGSAPSDLRRAAQEPRKPTGSDPRNGQA